MFVHSDAFILQDANSEFLDNMSPDSKSKHYAAKRTSKKKYYAEPTNRDKKNQQNRKQKASQGFNVRFKVT